MIITSLGVMPRLCNYKLGNDIVSTRFSSVAIAILRKVQDCQALVLSTELAHKQHFDELRSEFGQHCRDVKGIIIPDGRNTDEISEIVGELIENVPEGTNVVLDITQGLRHMPFAYMAALTYLSGLKDVSISGIFNCPFELKDEYGNVPVVDLTQMFNLLQWYQALQSAKETGQFMQLSSQLNARLCWLYQTNQGDTNLSKAKDSLKSMSKALSSGLPLEVGVYASELKSAIEKLDSGGERSLTARLAIRSLKRHIAQWAVSDCRKKSCFKEKLGSNELKRQLYIVSWFAQHDNVPAALLLLREWLVSFTIFAAGKSEWLNPDSSNSVRHEWEEYLGRLVRRSRYKLANGPEEERIKEIWSQVSSLRNQYAHNGMMLSEVDVDASKVKKLIEDCEKLVDSNVKLQAKNSRAETLLITPLGLSPGVLYSGLLGLSPRPSRAIIVTSDDGEAKILPALEAAGVPELPIEVLKLKDPIGGFGEGEELSQRVKSHVGAASSVIVNVTGGTTAMQCIVDRLWEMAGDMGVNRTKIALLDRRSLDEQRSSPYVQSGITKIREEKSVLSDSQN